MKQSLNFNWHYVPRFEKEFLDQFPVDSVHVDIPHTNKLLPFNYFGEQDFQFISTYELSFDVDVSIEGRTLTLHFDGIMAQAHLYLNGIDLGNHVSTYLPFDLDVTGKLKQQGNRLVVVCDSREDPEIPPFGGEMDYISYGGIYREVSLLIRPKTYIETLEAIADDQGHLRIRYQLGGTLLKDPKISFELWQNEAKIADILNLEATLKDIQLWGIDHPNLYVLKAKLQLPSEVEEKSIRFGFRSVRFAEDGFYLNGKHIKLMGLNRHQSFPYVGYAMPKSIQAKDADILKFEMGVNIVRSSHYPPSDHFLDRCDEIGLLVFDEIPGWQFIGQTPLWRQRFLDFVFKMAKKDFNHPCVVCEGVRINESPDDHELYVQSNKIFHDYDPSRPTGGVRNFKHSELLEDVYTYNDFFHNGPNEGLENPSKIHPKHSPYLITEYNGHMYPTKSTDNEDMRVNQTFRHLNVLNSVFKYSEVSGGIGWCFADYNTHKDFGSGDHICYHGVCDMFRIPKFASGAYASQQDRFPYLEVISSMNIGEHPEAMLGKTVVLTNADYLEFFKNDQLINTFFPDKKRFKYLPHPPIVVDDYIGDAVEKNEKFSKRDCRALKEALRLASLQGFNHLPLKTYLSIGWQMLKNRLKYDDLVRMWNTYVSHWGQKQVVYTFKAYSNQKLIATKTIGPALRFNLKAFADKQELINDETYDATRIVVKLEDEFGGIAQYTPCVVHVEAEEGLAILGPKDVSLVGGSTGIYVRSVKDFKGPSKLHLATSDYGSITLEITVK